MIGFKVFRSVPTTLDLNGPTLSFLQEPVGIVTVESSASFTGIVTATPVGTGHLSYQWYEIGVGAIGSGSTANVGIATTLTLTGLVDPDDTGRQFYLETKYVASAYGVGRSTGTALNQPFLSDTVGLGIAPVISITTQPGIATAVTNADAKFNITATTTNSTDNLLVYQWQQNGSDLIDSTTVAGSATTSLTISSDTVGVSTIRCVVSHPTASNSPLNSNTVDFNVVADGSRKILYVEEFDVNAKLYNTQIVNLVDGALEIIPSGALDSQGDWNRIYSIYAPETDISVKVTLQGAAGKTVYDVGQDENFLSGRNILGGQGGTSEFNLNLIRNQEYVANLGAAAWPSGGNTLVGGVQFINGFRVEAGDGGGGSFFYKGGELLVACGGGGGAGAGGRGIVGNYSFASMQGKPGNGGGIGFEPSLTTVGEFPGGLPTVNTTGTTGGRVAKCTIGDFWQTQGISPCASIGSTTFFTGKDGQKTANLNGSTVVRGYKAGLNYQFNGGNGEFNYAGGGGGGSQGGKAGLHPAAGGDGGLGFDGLGTATGTLGGNTREVGVIKIEAV